MKGGGAWRPNHRSQRALVAEDLFYGQCPHRQYQARPKQRHFALEMHAAARNFIRRRLTIAAPASLAGEAARDRRNIDSATKGRFIDAQGLRKPSKHSFARCPCKRPPETAF